MQKLAVSCVQIRQGKLNVPVFMRFFFLSYYFLQVG